MQNVLDVGESDVDINSAHAVKSAINKILIRNNKGYETRFIAKCAVTRSFEEAMGKLNLNGKWLSGKLKAQFEEKMERGSESIYFYLTDAYYTAVVDLKNKPAEFLYGNVSEKNQELINPSDQPLFINSVTYGRLILCKAVISEEKVKKSGSVAIEQKFSGIYASASAFAEKLSTLDVSDFEILVMGGYKDINTDKPTLEYLKDLIVNGRYPSDTVYAYPISFTLLNLNNESFQIRYTVPDFIAQRYTPIAEIEIAIKFKSLRLQSPPNSYSERVYGRFFVNTAEVLPRTVANRSFGEWMLPQNFNAANPLTFETENIVFLKLPISERPDIKIWSDIGELIEPGRRGYFLISGAKEFNTAELILRNEIVISDSLISYCIYPQIDPSRYKLDFEMIIDPKENFDRLYHRDPVSYTRDAVRKR